MDKNFENIYEKNLSDDEKYIADVIGLENLLLLKKNAGGSSIYISSSRNVLNSARDECIINEYNGTNIKELGRKYGLSDRWIREIIKNKRKTVQKKSSKSHENNKIKTAEQLSIFEITKIK